MNVALRKPWTVERFLAWEDEQEGKHEFDGVQAVPMTGGTWAHQRIVFNLLRLLDDLLDPDRFRAAAEMRLSVGRWARYPDVSVIAGRVPDATRTLRDAVVLFEVLSDETAGTDNGAKRAEYAEVPGLRRYVLLAQSRVPAVVLERTAEGWAEAGADAELALPELGVTLPLADIYRGVGVS